VVVDFDLGPHAWIAALNVVIAAAGLYVAGSYYRWWSGARDQLRRLRLGALPLSVFWLVLWLSVESAYYATARVLAALDGPNLWGATAAVLIVRVCTASGMLYHMIPRWRSLHVPEATIHRRVVHGCIAMVGGYFALVWVLY